MTGTIINVAAILAGGITGLTIGRELSLKTQSRLKMFLGALTVYAGMSMVWQALNGTFLHVVKQLAVAFFSLIVGNLIGKGLRLQSRVNKLGAYARESLGADERASSDRFSEGFVTCAILFCVGPMALLGSIQDGLTGNFKLLAVKSVMDGLATLAFVKTFGWSPMLAALPVLAYQGSITLAATHIEPWMRNSAMLDAVNATGGLLVMCIAVVILGIQRAPLADYLPSLLVAALLGWLW